MASFNQVQLLGNIGRIDIKTFTGGSRIAECSLATSERYKDRNGDWQDETQWHKLIIGGKLADIAERYVHKGDPLFVQGVLKYRTYTDRDGNERTVTEIRVTTLQLLSKGKGDAHSSSRDDDDDMPDDFDF